MSTKNFERNVALIGAGYWGKNLARNLHELGTLHTLCDLDTALLERYRDQYPDVHLSSCVDEVLANDAISCVMIAAPALLHYQLARRVLRAGKDVYVEKPLCLETSEAEELIQLAEELGLVLMVGHILQYHPCIQRLQELLGRGDLGKLQYVVSNRLNLGSIRTEENALWNFAPHDVSLILSLFGHRLPDQVRSVGSAFISKGVADVSMTTIRFPGNVRAHIYVSWLNPYKEQKLVVVGSAGLAVFDDTQPWDDKLVIYRNHVRWSDGHIPLVDDSDKERVQVPHKEPLKEECLHFLTCCRDRLKPLTDGQEALRVLKVLQAAQYSINEEGRAYNPQVLGSAGAAGQGFFVHPSAVVDPGAIIGGGSKIGPFCHIRSGAHIGDSCTIGESALISKNVVAGNKLNLGHGVSCHPDLIIGHDVTIGSGSVLACPSTSSQGSNDETRIDQGVQIGSNVTIARGVHVGHHSIIASGSVVTEDVAPESVIGDNSVMTLKQCTKTGA